MAFMRSPVRSRSGPPPFAHACHGSVSYGWHSHAKGVHRSWSGSGKRRWSGQRSRLPRERELRVASHAKGVHRSFVGFRPAKVRRPALTLASGSVSSGSQATRRVSTEAWSGFRPAKVDSQRSRLPRERELTGGKPREGCPPKLGRVQVSEGGRPALTLATGAVSCHGGTSHAKGVHRSWSGVQASEGGRPALTLATGA